MRRSLMLGAIAGLLACSSALAADLPMKATPVPVQPASWTGFYVGANAGYGNATEDQSIRGANPFGNAAVAIGLVPSAAATADDGWLAGAQVGYNLQMGRVVYGVEADFQWANIKGSGSQVLTLQPVAVPLSLTTQASAELEWFGTLTGRIGWLANDRVLIYGKGGLAYGSVNHTTSVTLNAPSPLGASAAGSASDTKIGWTLGAGIEAALQDGWSARAEYDYLDLGSTSVSFGTSIAGVVPVGFASEQEHKFHLFRVGLNKKFGS